MLVDEHRCVDDFTQWLLTSPCRFARIIAKKGPRLFCSVILDELSSADLDTVAESFDRAGAAGHFAAMLFPRVRQIEEIRDLLITVGRHPRWSMRRVPWNSVRRDAETPIGLTWTTKARVASSAMGFAPLGSMPASRRAQYVAIVAWPGGADGNVFVKKRATTEVGFINGAHGLEEAKYRDVLRDSRKLTEKLFEDPVEDREWLRDVAFLLPNRAASRVFREVGVPQVRPRRRK